MLNAVYLRQRHQNAVKFKVPYNKRSYLIFNMDAEKENYGSIENQESKQSRLVD